ncbi:MAG TPA: hypothetical protein DD381_12780 [Lentisphaeria bacterium]|nr:MAG: hypothetical protein A2X47_12350 [Lentisphaerae bacterium GWF2_38_69]HBM17199.1 hypothetical protein [Lentisphaeria bacterium]
MGILRRTKIGRGYHNLLRARSIITVLIKHGFMDFVDNSRLIQAMKLSRFTFKKHQKEEFHKHFSHWERLRLACEELGPTFVKLGQFLSNRPDLIPSELCAEFEKLLENVPPFRAELAKMIFESSLNVKIDKVFKEFDPDPFSSASVAQVHRAVLLDGTKVAVKIQRPGIKAIIESDLEIMMFLALTVKKHMSEMSALDPVAIVNEFSDGIRQELDFSREALNIEKFSRMFSEEKELVVPKVFKEFSNKDILTMLFIEGVKFSNYAGTEEEIKKICEKLANLVLRQIFQEGYFHADPHSGNIIITDDLKICFIDFGLMGLLPPKHKTSLCDIILGLVNHDPELITRAIISLSHNKEVDNRAEIEHQAFKIMEQYAYLPIEDINIGHFLRDLLKLLVQNKLLIPTDIFLLLKSLISLEGTIRKIMPNFDMISHIEPFIKKLLYRTRSPYKLIRDLLRAGVDYSKFLAELPSELRDILTQFKNKTLKIQFEHRGLEPLLAKHDNIVNRLSFAIITASMILGSAMLLNSKVPPLYHGISIPGSLFFMFSAFMGLLLIISILRHGKM